MLGLGKITPALLGLCVLATGCDLLFPQDFERFDGAFEKVPLPPGTESFRIDGSDSTDFYFSSEYTNKTETELAEFYRTFFKDNGWTSNFPQEEESNGLLDYQKGKASINVTTVAIRSQIHLMVIYREDKYTHEEFAKLVAESETPETKDLIRRVQEAYGQATSYSDTGSYECINDGEILSRAHFKTRYRDPGDLLFEYQDENTHTLSKRGDQVKYMSDFDAAPTEDHDIDLAISALYGVTSRTSGNIPQLLLNLDEGSLFYLAGLKLLDEAKSEDGTLCLRLQGVDFGSEENTLWIGKEDLLIRKIETVKDPANRETTIYKPQTGVEITDGELVFRTPEAKN
ncbi:MAG: hypothetical protein JNK74_26165 [Candidatus Hydrogenedentes bacterium]|nr:hypothetical protein [Candidatus Hydrogenedentota bacterium]